MFSWPQQSSLEWVVLLRVIQNLGTCCSPSRMLLPLCPQRSASLASLIVLTAPPSICASFLHTTVPTEHIRHRLLLWGYRYHWVEVVLSLLDVHGVPGTHKVSRSSIWGLNKGISEWFNELVNVSIFFSCWKKSTLSTEDQWHAAILLPRSLMKRLGKAWETKEMAPLVKRLATQVCGPEFESQHLHKKAYSTHP